MASQEGPIANPRDPGLHPRLLAFFQSHGSLEPGRDADETLDRFVRKLGEGHVIRDVPAYVHGLARNVLREARHALPPLPVADALLWDRFDLCLAQLEPDRAELLVAYYSAARSSNRAWRSELAARRSLSLNALRVRVFRAREALRERLVPRLTEGTDTSAKPEGGTGPSRLENDEADLRRYLLGQMSDTEEAGVERAYLESDDALEKLRAREDELIEEYLAGALESAERERFEGVFLASPARLERLVFLRVLQDRVAPRARRLVPAPGARSWMRAATVLAIVVAVGLVGARALGRRPSPVDVPPLPARQAAAPAEASVPPPQVVELRLRQPGHRGAGDDAPVLDLGVARHAVLEAPIDPRDGFTAHRGRVAAPDGRDAFVSPWQPNRGEASLRVVVPSGALRDGRHVLVVEAQAATGEEPVASYAFRVRRR